MRWLLLLAVVTVGCGDNPLAPSASVVPPVPTQALCVVTVPATPGFWITLPGGATYYVPGHPERYLVEPCD